jgi:phospholipase/carboxylesterase
VTTLPFKMRPALGPPEGALVLLHGRGADELDLLPLLDELDPERRLVGVTPGAPLQLGPAGRHWYVVREIGHPDRDTFRAGYETAAAWLDDLPALTGVPLAQTVVGGFSQGAVMSYALALGTGRPSPAALIALSGFIPRVEGFTLDPWDHRDVPVAIGHGSRDAVIHVGFGRDAHALLSAAGLSVLYRESPLAHTIDPSFARELSHWLSRRLDLAA